MDVSNMEPQDISNELKVLVEHGFTLPRSPESDVLLVSPIIDAGRREEEYSAINTSWDGKSVRHNPTWDNVTLEESA